MKKLLMFFASLLLICSCSSDSDVLTGTVQGTVTEMINGESRPLTDVLVRIDGGGSVTTDNNGHYTFMDIDAQAYKLHFSKYGYHSTTRDINIIAGKTVNCDVRLDSEKKDLLIIEPASLNFGTTQNELPVVITNKGNKELTWNLDLGQHKNWLSVSPASGQLASGKTQTIVFSIDRSNIGDTKSVVVNLTAGGSSFPITINCGVEDKTAQMIVEPANIDFGTEDVERDITIKNVGTETLTWTVKNLVSDYITLSEKSSSVAPGGNKVIKIMLDRSQMKEDLSTSFVISDGLKDIKVSVSAQYEKKTGKLQVDKSNLDFGSTENVQTFTIRNKGNATMNWSVENFNEDCISISPVKGTLAPNDNKTISVTLNRDKMSGDIYTSFIITDGTNKVKVNVVAEMQKASVSVNPKTLDFGKSEIEKIITLRNDGNVGTSWNISGLNASWLTVSPASGYIQNGETINVAVKVNRANLNKDETTTFKVNAAGNYTTVEVHATPEDKPQKEDYSSAEINVNDPRIAAKITDCKRTGTTITFNYTLENKDFDEDVELTLLSPIYWVSSTKYKTCFYDDLGNEYGDMNNISMKLRDHYTGWENNKEHVRAIFPKGFPCKASVQIKEVDKQAKKMNFKIAFFAYKGNYKVIDDKIEFLNVPIY